MAKSNSGVDRTVLAAVEAQMNRLKRWEASNEVYQEMCAAADAKHLARASVFVP